MRKNFIAGCTAQTQELHNPIINLSKVDGALNPSGLGNAEELSNKSTYTAFGQSTVAFESQSEFNDASNTGIAKNHGGAAEYGIVRHAAGQAVAEKFTKLYDGAGAVIYPSGITAITNFLLAFPEDDDEVILLPEGCYYPTTRALEKGLKKNYVTYPSDADEDTIRAIFKEIIAAGKKPGLLYMEAPDSNTFIIPEIEGLVKVAKEFNTPRAIDNTYANHVGFEPFKWDIDIAIEAATKYSSGWADTAFGVIVSRTPELHEKVAYMARVMGAGAVDPKSCNRLYHRVDDTKNRMQAQQKTAEKLCGWFNEQAFVKDVMAPYLPESPQHERFKKYFKIGNGLFTVVFNENVTPEQVEQFLDSSPLTLTGESWGGHITLHNQTTPARPSTHIPSGEKVRFSSGLEDAKDIVRSLELAKVATFRDYKPTMS